MPLSIRSSAFSPDGTIPRKYTCEGDDVSPAIQWSGIPDATKSLALIVQDPDAPDPKAPKMTYIHWVVYDIPAQERGLAEGVRELPSGARDGLNDWKRTGYGGPCPPIGRHRYYFRLFALDRMLGDLSGPTAEQLEQAMRGHTLEAAAVMGTYQKGD